MRVMSHQRNAIIALHLNLLLVIYLILMPYSLLQASFVPRFGCSGGTEDNQKPSRLQTYSRVVEFGSTSSFKHGNNRSLQKVSGSMGHA